MTARWFGIWGTVWLTWLTSACSGSGSDGLFTPGAVPSTGGASDEQPGAGGDPGSAGRLGTGGSTPADGGGESGAGSTTDGGVPREPGDAGTSASGGSANGAGGSSSSGGASSGGASGAGGHAGAGGTVAAGGAVGAGGQESGGAGGCAQPKTYYPDGDHDLYGRTDGATSMCTPPDPDAWAVNPGDCDDEDPRVHPGQTEYFDQPYSVVGGDSFDFDCSKAEEGDPTMDGAAPSCSLLSIVGCGGTGFSPTQRSGAGRDSLCGSKTTVTCTPSALSCNPVAATVQDGYRCH